ncbi:hypothetical protein C6Y14_39245 [Streptomyces dioscori]|uniref:Uncharacterized protein n=1 Tax=Streptomyces dioscori TaxID=2109333 RepID=A0A2P8PVJ4_9ACTN|nr:hypothetical protein C6Y14_39245 [Streptomyces dioscori]
MDGPRPASGAPRPQPPGARGTARPAPTGPARHVGRRAPSSENSGRLSRQPPCWSGGGSAQPTPRRPDPRPCPSAPASP